MCSARQWQCGWCLRYNGRDCDTDNLGARAYKLGSETNTRSQGRSPVAVAGAGCRARGPAGLVLVRRFSVLYTAVIRL